MGPGQLELDFWEAMQWSSAYRKVFVSGWIGWSLVYIEEKWGEDTSL